MITWKIYARDALLRRQGEVDDFADLEVVRRWNDVGTWVFKVDRRSPLAGVLRQPGAGIIIAKNGTIWSSGSWTRAYHEVDGAREVLTLSGKDDNVWLKRRLASPSPTEAIPPYSQAYDVRTGVATTILRQFFDVNIGPSAVSVRRRSEMTLGADPAAGTTVTGRARWQVLLSLLQELALTGGVGFNLVQSGTSLQFQTSAVSDQSASVRFSRGLGNLAEFTYDETAPEANYEYVGGSGEAAARTIYEKSDAAAVATWGRFEGEFVDRRDTAVSTELDQAAAEALTEQAAKRKLTATLVDTPTMAFGTAYDLGTKVTVELDNPGSTDVVQDIVRRVTLTGDEKGFKVEPAIGQEGTQDTGLEIYRTVRRLQERLVNLERR